MSLEDIDNAKPAIPHGLHREQLLELYYYMRLTRTLEERLETLKRQGKRSEERRVGQEGRSRG